MQIKAKIRCHPNRRDFKRVGNSQVEKIKVVNSHALLMGVENNIITSENCFPVPHEVKDTPTLSPNNSILEYLLERKKNTYPESDS